MSTRSRLLSWLCLLFGFFLVACSNPEAAHLHGAAGTSGTAGTAGVTGAAGVGSAGTTGLAGDSGAGTAGTTGLAGDSGAGTAGTTGLAGATGAAGTGAAGTGAAGTGAAGTGAAGTGAAGTGAAGTGAAGTGAAGTGAAGTGAAGTGAAGTGAAGTGAAGTGAAGTGAAGTGAAGTPGLYSNYCSSVHWTYSAPTAINAMDFLYNVADGNIASRWSTGANQAPGQYFQVDFGGTVSLTQVVLDASNNTGDYPRGYDIGLSANGTTFVSVATGAGAQANPIITATFQAAQGRYLRINQTGSAAAYWSIDELHFGCTVPGNHTGLIDPYDPTSWTASASKAAAGNTPDKAIDADPTSRWATGAQMAAGDNFTVNIGGPAMLSGVTFDCGGGADFPVAYKLEVSTDGVAYTQVAVGPGTAGLTKVTFPRQTVRAFKITQTATTGTNWWSIYNITLVP